MKHRIEHHPLFGKTLFWDNSVIEIGVPLEFGLRICHFSFCGEKNVFFEQPRELTQFSTPEGWHIRGGHRLWLAPEGEYDYYPDNQPIAYAQKVGELTNMLGDGHIMVQRFGDILDGKRTWAKELAQSNVRPTLPDAVAGDITAAMPYRAMTNIINFIQAMDHVVPGFASYETLLYSPELKFYSNRIRMDKTLNTNIQGLHCLGDSSGWTRGLMMASAMGVLMGREIAKEG